MSTVLMLFALVLIITVILGSHEYLSSYLYILTKKSTNIPLADVNIIKLLGGNLNSFEPVFEKYGKTFKVRMGLRLGYFISNPADVELIMNDRNNVNKPTVYNKATFFIGKGLGLIDDPEWTKRRKMLNPCFGYKLLLAYSTEMSVLAESAIVNIRSIAKCDEEIDIELPMRKWVFDNLCKTIMGITIEDDEKFFTAFRSSIKYKLGFFTMWLPKLLFAMSQNGRNMIENVKNMEKLVYKVIKEKKAAILNNASTNDGTSNKSSLIELLISSNQFTDEQIKNEILIFLIAGHDTTTVTVSFCIYELAQNPIVQRKVYDEIKSILSAEKKVVHYEDLNKLKYLNCVIKETMRMYPALSLIGRRNKRSVKLSGDYVLPAGSDVYIDMYRIHHDPDIYQEPYKFKPDRFEEDIKSARCSYLAFAAGPRNCIGLKFAMIEMKIMLATFISTFEILPSKNKLTVRRRYVIETRNGVPVILKKRIEK